MPRRVLQVMHGVGVTVLQDESGEADGALTATLACRHTRRFELDLDHVCLDEFLGILAWGQRADSSLGLTRIGNVRVEQAKQHHCRCNNYSRRDLRGLTSELSRRGAEPD